MRIEPLREATPRNEVAAYYDAKTEGILRRYGPGPRVHYHTGMVDETPPPGLASEALKVLIHESQEVLLRELAQALGSQLRGREVLDVGCGLGGGSLYWASVHGARVTAVTISPEHIAHVRRFASMVGVGERVNPLLCDALDVPDQERFELVVAVESSCYLPRRAWFRKVRHLLRPGGVLAIADCFLGRPELAMPFDRYWRTHIGSVEEYFRSATAEGLELELHQDLSGRAVNFWTLTLDLMAREHESALRSGQPSMGRSESQREHLRLQQAFLDGGLHYGMMVLRRAD
ncbi:SAM-dependent methyltransferase [Hyalangium versicolor]|uniref:SAM-dependent methyltransferase n=1 Tax=Hyalangium versicolor TaxID=2861190 RepID=UPI001CD016FE|nr:class I SAM-dependent methyltransferase [Hyalangium versicolor]